jgi:6-phosphofructokinase 2
MKSILTLTLNPAIDKNTSADRVLPEHKIRCEQPVYEPGGGGINVARAIKKLGGEASVLFTKGGNSGHTLSNLLLNEGLDLYPIETQTKTRENFIIVEKSTNKQYRFGMPGQSIRPSEAHEILETLKKDDNKYDYLVVSGSTPKGIDAAFYYEISSIVKAKKAKLVLDTSGEALKEALKIGIHLVKPNLAELGELLQASDEDLDTAEEQEQAAKELISKYPIDILTVSLGPFGAMAATAQRVTHIPAPSVKKQSTVGAGDSMVGGIVLSLSQNKDIFDSVKYGVACGTAATMNTGTSLCKKTDADKLYKWILENSR